MAINNFNIFKRLSSDNPNERHIAADKLYESFKRDGGHPDDWELRRRGHHGAHILADVEASLRAAAELREQAERKAREKAELEAERQSEARAQAEAELSKLRDQLRRAKRKAATTEYVDLLSGLLRSSVIDAMGPDDIGAKIEALFAERDRRDHNRAAQVDLVIGQLTGALYRCYAEQFGKRKRGSGTPTMTEYLEQYADKSASWCRRCYKAYCIVTSDDWQQDRWDGRGGIEGIIRSASQPRPVAKRVSKVQRRLDALSQVVRNRQWQNAEAMVNEWDSN